MFLTVNAFCAAHSISRSLFYRLVKDGRGPRVTKINNKTLISSEAAANWRERMERETEAAELTPRGRAKQASTLLR
jgi:predicted DNA-binding transcriptional regulator AlpA